jgi:hypothetical protein
MVHSLGEGCVIHPTAKLIASHGGPIILGKNNIIEEGVTLINKYASLWSPYYLFKIAEDIPLQSTDMSATFGFHVQFGEWNGHWGRQFI